MSLRESAAKGVTDAMKQKDHEREGHDQGILDSLTGHKCYYNPPSDPAEKKAYDEMFWHEYRKKD